MPHLCSGRKKMSLFCLESRDLSSSDSCSCQEPVVSLKEELGPACEYYCRGEAGFPKRQRTFQTQDLQFSSLAISCEYSHFLHIQQKTHAHATGEIIRCLREQVRLIKVQFRSNHHYEILCSQCSYITRQINLTTLVVKRF